MAYVAKPGLVRRRRRRPVVSRRRIGDVEDDPSWYDPNLSSGANTSGLLTGVTNTVGGFFGSSIAGLSSAMDVMDNAVRKYGNGKTPECLAQANEYTSKLDAQWYKLATDWQPTGTYKPSDVSTIVGAVSNILIQAKLKVMFAPWTAGDAVEQIQQAIKDVDKKIVEGGRFQTSANDAQKVNGVVNAPELKDWVISSMVASSNAFATAFFMSCDVTWLEQMLTDIQGVIGTVTHIIGVILETAVAAGQAVVNTAKGAFDALAFLAENSKWIILGGVAYIGYRMLKRS